MPRNTQRYPERLRETQGESERARETQRDPEISSGMTKITAGESRKIDFFIIIPNDKRQLANAFPWVE